MPKFLASAACAAVLLLAAPRARAQDGGKMADSKMQAGKMADAKMSSGKLSPGKTPHGKMSHDKMMPKDKLNDSKM